MAWVEISAAEAEWAPIPQRKQPVGGNVITGSSSIWG